VSPSLAICTLVASLAAMAAGAVAQPAPADFGPASAIELALTERTCSAGVYNPDPDVHEQCMSVQLKALRGDFGRDLRRLAPGERTAFDAACGRLNTAVTREAYLDCLNGQIVARRKRLQISAGELRANAPLIRSASAAQPLSESSRRPNVLPLAIAMLGLAAVGVLVFGKRPLRRTCDACKQPMTETARLCAECRRVAADAFRRAKEDQTAEQMAHAALRRQQDQRAQEQRHRATLREESERFAQAEQARRSEEEHGFDPYAVLGVASGADLASVRAAFQAAKSKYEPGAVSHLGYDVQEHYRQKTEAAARAFDLIAGAHA
jgi:hypothetical protein